MRKWDIAQAVALSTAVLFVVQGCAHALSPGVVSQADRPLFVDIDARPDQFVGKLVILGGTIDGIRNTTRGTVIEVSVKKLDHWGRPLPGRSPEGSLVVVNEAFDPPLSAVGLDITVAGVVAGTQDAIDDISNTGLVLLSREFKLWPRARPSRNQPHYLDPLYDPHTSTRQF